MAYERENLIEKHLVAEVKKAGGVAYKFISPGHRSVPDRIVLLPGGRIVFVECKAPGKPPRADQQREHERLRTLGFSVVVLGSKNLEEILQRDRCQVSSKQCL
ncbi:VRR-NUC domain-containing protein [Salmonella enterica]|nr:VRR-NUC domain-containing protein [Salmonella enterica]EBX9739588.1 VRR-NUC domain-containing protein [Salmonella enterica subsp. enterica serovar Javiana]ECS6612973.1 VRR-NUC domain-containing protein [Salmonella enterica subsp. enterica serovar Give]HCM2020757.1 VRR-NUC domain-containing protein [Salmonella enterica subsp. houtenae serovar 48:g,z51:-]EDD5571709.1 VRR-NUC domain-containing protein [Salmonella enterica]